jgi:hypothetical protein
MDKRRAKAVLRELKKRLQNKVDVLKDALPQQKEFINDPSKLKAILATRRASKSFTAGLYLFKEALDNPGVSCLYLALTRDSAKKIMVKDVMSTINKKYKIGAKFNKTELSYTLPNGSIIYLLGIDSDEDEKDKVLGQKFKLVVIDEAASFKTDQKELVYKILKPAMTDLKGTIIMIGTPGNNIRSLFYKVTTGEEKGWTVYNWKATDNPYVAKQIQDEMAELIAANPLIVETPLWRQMYKGEWVIELDKLVYRYNEERNSVSKLPDISHKTNWKYILGIDLGWEDASAFVVCAYNEFDTNLYIVKTYKKSQMDITDVANKIKSIMKDYEISKFIVDGASKQAVEEIKNRHKIPLITADKAGKADFINLMNAEMIQGKIKLLDKETEDLTTEWQTLIWDEKAKKKTEHSACPNHLADAALYAWRYCYNYLSERETPPPDPTSEEAVDAFWEKEADNLDRKKAVPFWEREY